MPARSVVENVYLGIEDSALGVVKRGALDKRFAGAHGAHRHQRAG